MSGDEARLLFELSGVVDVDGQKFIESHIEGGCYGCAAITPDRRRIGLCRRINQFVRQFRLHGCPVNVIWVKVEDERR